MNVIFTCGGTGGHINPAISVANLLRERMPDSKILFIGAEDGMEKNLVPRAGYELETIRISNFQRKLTPAGVWHNVTTACHMAGSMQKAKKIIRAFQPDVIVGTGGYASYPALHMGAKLGIPTAVHESNAVPGLTTRMVAGHVSRIMVSLADSSNQYPDPEKVTVTGTPVGSAFLYGDREKARAALGIGDEPLIVSAWGSLGAREMNKKVVSHSSRDQPAVMVVYRFSKYSLNRPFMDRTAFSRYLLYFMEQPVEPVPDHLFRDLVCHGRGRRTGPF